MKLLFKIFVVFISVFMLSLPIFASNNLVVNNLVVDQAGRLLMVEMANNQEMPKPKVFRLLNPERLILDIPNATLGMKQKLYKINNSEINNVRILNMKQDKKSFVRIIAENKPGHVIEKIKVSPGKGSTVIQLMSLPEKVSTLGFYNDGQIKITQIDYRDDQLIIGAIGKIRIKEPYVLKSPSRLVVDIPNARVASKDLLSPIIVGDDKVDVIRIGQFDQNTVRIVVETEIPNQFYPVYGNDQRMLFVLANPSFSKFSLPKGINAGYIKDIEVLNDPGFGTLVKIKSTNSISYRIRRLSNPEKLVVDILNVGPPLTDITSNLNETDTLSGIRVGQLMAGSSNSRVVLDLLDSSIASSTNVSPDGKDLEILLRAAPSTFAIKRHGIRVVLDAGHGGYDPGCQVAGYKEKDITLDVTRRTKRLLEKAGVKVYMTRTGDDTLSLKERTDFTGTINPDVFVSIHVNASVNSAPNGIDTHWYTNRSIPLATKVQQSLMKNIKATDRGTKKNMFYVIHHTHVPAVLVEMGFLTNPQERVKLLTVARKQKTAKGIAEGILDFLQGKRPAVKVEDKR